MPTPTYTLTEVQLIAFTQRFEVWKPVALPSRRGSVANGVVYELAWDDVPGRLAQRSEVAAPSMLGRSNYDIVLTMDVVRLHIAQECGDTYYLREKAGDDWYIIQGGPQQRLFRASTATYETKRGSAPPGAV
jgi:hypothetical protein